MLISKNMSEKLKNAFDSNFESNEAVLGQIRKGLFPESILNLKKAGFFKKIITISNPIIQASNRFVSKINENKSIASEWAKTKPDFKYTLIIFGEIYFVEKIGRNLFVVNLSPKAKEIISVKQDFSEETEWGMPISYISGYNCSNDVIEEFQLTMHSIFALFIFLSYTEIEEKVIKAKSKEKKPKKEDRDVNLSDFDVSVLSSTYYTKIYVEGAIGVSGHFKLQPCGEGRKDRKLIEIMPYTRNGYTRRSDIELGKAM